MNKQTKNTMIMVAAIGGLLATTGMVGSAFAEEASKVKCYGANKCKGQGACGGVGHSCAGKNACKGQGYIETDSTDACLKLEGGRLTAEKS